MSLHLRSARSVGLSAGLRPSSRRFVFSWSSPLTCTPAAGGAIRPGPRRPRRAAASPAGVRGRAAWSGAPRTRSRPRRCPAPAESTSTRHSAGRPTGVMPPYSMPDSLTARSMARNDALRTSRVALDQVVDVGPGVGAHQAGGDPLLAVAATGHHHAVGAGRHRQAVGLAHGGGVGHLRVDLDDGDVVGVLPPRQRRRGPAARAGPGGRRRGARPGCRAGGASRRSSLPRAGRGRRDTPNGRPSEVRTAIPCISTPPGRRRFTSTPPEGHPRRLH